MLQRQFNDYGSAHLSKCLITYNALHSARSLWSYWCV